MRRLWRLCESEQSLLLRGFALTAVAGLLATIPAFVAIVAVSQLSASDLARGDVVPIAVVCTGSLVARYLAARYANRLLWVVAYEITGRIRHRLLDQALSMPTMSNGEASEVLTLLTYDAGKIAGFLSWELPVLASGLVAPVVTLALVGVLEPVVALVGVLTLVIAVMVMRSALRQVEGVHHTRRAAQSDATEMMLEYVRGIDVIRAHGVAGERRHRLEASLDAVRDADVASVDRLTPAYSAFQTVVDASFATVLLASAAVVAATGSDTADSLVAALILATVALRPLLDVGARSLHLPELAASVARLDAWEAGRVRRGHGESMQFDAGVDVDGPDTSPPSSSDPDGGAVTFRAVHAGYGPHAVLHGVDLELPPNTVTALVGPSGAGKSTMLRLVAGLLTPSAGHVSIDGRPIATMSPQRAASLVTAVFQDVGVLHGTISTAIGSGDPSVGSNEIEQAARMARIHERIVELPHGYDTVLGEDGRGLSGGERQRLAIARAICKPAPVVLLDEATSALDATSERLLREAIRGLAAERTVLVVAHRRETIRHADHIVFLDEGTIREHGTHDELIAIGGRYAGYWSRRRHAAGWTIATGVEEFVEVMLAEGGDGVGSPQ